MNEQSVLTKACEELGIPIPDLISVDKFRWTIELKGDDDYKNLLKLERRLHQIMKRPIDIRLEQDADKMKRKQRNVLNGPK